MEHDHKESHRRLAYIAAFAFIILLAGVFFYHFFEGWSYLDAAYFSTATLTTVGYGDLTPVTPLGKIFTIMYMFGGIAIILYGLSAVVEHFTETHEISIPKNIHNIGSHIKSRLARRKR